MNPDIKNIEHSVRRRLLDVGRNRKIDYQFCLTHYSLERFLYRLSRSIHAEKFVLKGALLLMSWTNETYRPTRDLDLLGRGGAAPGALKTMITEICQSDVEPDGLVFDTETQTIEEIREDLNYDGYRVKILVYLGKVRIPIQIDIAFGDAVSPGFEILEYPSLLDLPKARVTAYPKETVVAEKLQAAVVLGIRNSRMKDFFDLLWLSRWFHFESKTLVSAIQATFKRRGTQLPETVPFPLTGDFAADPAKQAQWRAFLSKNDISHAPADLPRVISELCNFLMIPIEHSTATAIPEMVWKPGGPWNQKDNR